MPPQICNDSIISSGGNAVLCLPHLKNLFQHGFSHFLFADVLFPFPNLGERKVFDMKRA